MKREIRKEIIGNIERQRYDLAAKRISTAINKLRANIPDKMRASYGIVYAVRMLSEHLYKELDSARKPVIESAVKIGANGDDANSKMVALGLISFQGLRDFSSARPYIESAASPPDWNLREISQMFFRKLIAKHPSEARDFLMKLAKSNDGYLRRFVGETLRPVRENKWFYREPDYPLSILRCLFKESFPEARASVGNNLSDLSRKLPQLVYSIVGELVGSADRNSYWIAYRACRNLVRKEPIRVMDLLKVDEYKYKTRTYKRSDRQG